MMLAIDFGHPVFEAPVAEAITTGDLDNFYASAKEIDQLNLFFHLEASFHHHLNAGRDELAAHLAFLTAYYLFLPLTPPASYPLALPYIGQAVRLNPLPEYFEWQALIQKGN